MGLRILLDWQSATQRKEWQMPWKKNWTASLRSTGKWTVKLTSFSIEYLVYYKLGYLICSFLANWWKRKSRVTTWNPRVTSSNSRITSSNPRVSSSNPRVARLKTRVARSKVRVEKLKSWVRKLKARVKAIKPRVKLWTYELREKVPSSKY